MANTKRKTEKIIKEYYAECEAALDKAEKEYDKDKKSTRKREIKTYCFAQVAALEELMDKLDIDYDDMED